MSLRIRDLDLKDFKDVVENYYMLYDEVRENKKIGILLYKEKPDMRSELEWFFREYDILLSQTGVVKVAEVDGKVVGLCDIHPMGRNSETSHIGVLGILIRKEYRNRGIGKMILKESLVEGKNRFEIIILDVFESNHIAINLYKKFGFREYGRLPKGLKRNDEYITIIKMYLDLEKFNL